MYKQFFHGTSSRLGIKDVILPAVDTGILREDFRKRNLNKVYITTSYGSAYNYAIKACKKYGGKPVIYEVRPDFNSLVRRIDCEYITDFAKIVK